MQTSPPRNYVPAPAAVSIPSSTGSSRSIPRFSVGLATRQDRETIYRIRHEVYAHELGQHPANAAGRLRDPLDAWNSYVVVKVAGVMAGFISLTPAGAPAYSIDKYFPREELPFAVDDRFVEVRLLTVLQAHRGREVAALLMYAALRWVEARGGDHVAAIGRREVLDLYTRLGLERVGLTASSGRVTYELMHATLSRLRDRLGRFAGLLQRLRSRTDWALPFAFDKPASCFHGGSFFTAIGERFDSLARRELVINADVLDAPYPPAPGVVQTMLENLPWILMTSPPADCSGLVQAIAEARGVQPGNVLPGAGSSDLIFRALPHWLGPASQALILDPTYGEYAHVLEKVIGCTVDRLILSRAHGYAVDLDRLRAALADDYNLVVVVNPNSPTGRHIPRAKLEELLRHVPPQTRVWVDETYVEYAGTAESLEPFAAHSENVIVCKSMSKVYALSGARVAYLCASPHQLESLRAVTPPWVVGLPAQIAAVRALEDPDYYAGCLTEVARNRVWLHAEFEALGWRVIPSITNFLLCELPNRGPDSAALIRGCREAGLFLRDASTMGSQIGKHTLRVAVKDAITNRRMVELIRKHLARA